MVRVRFAAASLAAVLLWSATARAQIAGHPIEVSAGAGWSEPDARARVKGGPAYIGAVGYRLTPQFSIEASGNWMPSKSDSSKDRIQNFSLYSLDLRVHLRPAHDRLVPYLIGGMGYGTSNAAGGTPQKLSRGAPSFGMGLLWNILNQRTYLRFQVRDVLFREREATEFGNNFSATAGVHYVFGGKERDQDLDKVRDWIDECPNTPIGAKVNAAGCPTDADADSVFDGLDQCPDTPRGCVVDANGCPTDADGDGVCDGLDRCADTPKGAKVDASGCPLDSDGDGVFDGIDGCEGTPTGCVVDAKGCPVDSDGDGVCDGRDSCAATPRGIPVDEKGCPRPGSEMEIRLLETGLIRTQNIQFTSGKSVITPESYAVLDQIGEILGRHPSLKIEIGVHSDNAGSKSASQKLTQARAQAVLDYLKTKYTAIAPQLSAKGYGMSAPIAPNTSEAGRARNRRVEFRVLNPGALREERSKTSTP